jgi:lipoate-protein ligase A
MQHFEHSLTTPAENVAFDEAILEWAEMQPAKTEFLRLWESARPMVVVGRSSHVEKEVDVAFCRREGIPILRRSSGGAAIVAGPGCLMYAVVLSHAVQTELRDITRAHAFVMKQLTRTIGPLVADAGTVACAGTSDLVIEQEATQMVRSREPGEGILAPRSPLPAPRSPLPAPCSIRKFSGNSMRMKRTHLLYHGTLLYNFDLALIEKCLRSPPRQPEYRRGRAHGDFVTNLPLSRERLAEAVASAFPTARGPDEVPLSRVGELVAERFSKDAWNYEFA